MFAYPLLNAPATIPLSRQLGEHGPDVPHREENTRAGATLLILVDTSLFVARIGRRGGGEFAE
jgi:hypothetical protein